MNKSDILNYLSSAFESSDLPLSGKISGKVRDWYPLTDNRRLLVTTDRLSAFDRILTSIPFKGQVLNQLSAWWFENTTDIIQNHIIQVPDPNAVTVKDAQPLKVEVIVRGYITGVTKTALWYRYALGERDIYGYSFPNNLRKNQELPEAIITPTTKGGPGSHDERLSCAEVTGTNLVNEDDWEKIQRAALQLFKYGQAVASKAGLILVDTKYEFGKLDNGDVILIDEVHTPDSSRFWNADSYNERFESSQEPENFDKEFIRLAYSARGFVGDGEVPDMPEDLWVSASEKYISIYEKITGNQFIPGSYPVNQRLENNLKKAGIL